MKGRAILPAVVGVGGAAAVTAGLALGLSFPPLLAGALGLVIGAGGAFLSVASPGEDKDGGEDRARVAELLNASIASAQGIEPQIRALSATALWDSTPLDENLLRLCASVRGVAALPAVAGRAHVDGDILMLHTIATDYLPTVAALAREHDGMFAGFTESSRRDVVKNVADLNEQALILTDAIARIESDIVRGTTRNVQQHTEYLRARFNELGASGGLDIERAFRELDAETESGGD